MSNGSGRNGFFSRSKRQRYTRLAAESLEPRQLLAGDTFQICDSSGCRFVEPEGPSPQYVVNQPPRLQLGDAPLHGFPGSEFDQVDLLWQTKVAGLGSEDSFKVEFRRLNHETWTTVEEPIISVDTGVETRVVHQAKIRGLVYYADYEYRVTHLRGDVVVDVYQAEFKTRLPKGDTRPYTFAAYGDSAYFAANDPFRSVQNRINLNDPDFSLLLGDNIYNFGTHQDYDARFDPDLNPEAVEWIASHIDYLGIGNHGGAGERWRVSSLNFEVPTPVAGVTSPFEIPTTRLETNYSFDYGDVHFTTFNSNFYSRPSWLNVVASYAADDIAASDAKWKIVFAHHPTAGAPDKLHSASDDYFNQVIPRLREAGADLIFVGHSHTYSWTYPMLGQVDGEVIFVPDEDKDYDKGAGLIQVLSGAGGKELRPANYDRVPFAAAGFSTITTPKAAYGYSSVSVTPDQLTVSYIAADDGRVIDEFTITDRSKTEPQIETVYVRGSEWSPEFLELLQYEHGADPQLGVEVTPDFGQHAPLPWTNLDTISITFKDDVQVSADSLRVTGLVDNKQYSFVEDSFHLDSETNIATWQLSEPLISGGVSIELVPPTVAQAAATGEGPANELRKEFFPFAVLHGDVNADRFVTSADIDLLVASSGESSFLDLDGGPAIDDDDLEIVAQQVDNKIGGDTDFDGDVDFLDFLTLSRRFGNGSRWVDGDFNGDKVVDFRDFLVLSRNFGRTLDS